MIENLYVIKSQSYFPYHNQAVEKYLFDTVKDNSLILYLWQNKDTVFIGKNQNAFNECNVEMLEKKDCGYLARRISGGGAVFHDLGNLNFTFICHKDNYDLDKQNDVILEALYSLGITAEKNGRNDLTYKDRKFSGHAYYSNGINNLHHGTLMLDVSQQKLQRYLNVSKLKLLSKNVKSVSSRIINLKDLDDLLTIKDLKRALIDALESIYQIEPIPLYEDDLNEDVIKAIQEDFMEYDWKYGKIKQYDNSIEYRFEWGTIRVDYDMKENVVEDLAIYSDALNVENIDLAYKMIKGKNINELEYDSPKELKDIIKLIKGEMR